jgi:hypothetical protein
MILIGAMDSGSMFDRDDHATAVITLQGQLIQVPSAMRPLYEPLQCCLDQPSTP